MGGLGKSKFEMYLPITSGYSMHALSNLNMGSNIHQPNP